MRKYFITGLAVLLPLAVTVWVVAFVVNFLTKPFIGFMTHLLYRLPLFGLLTTPRSIRTLSQILILIGLFLVTLFLGFVARRYFFNGLLKMGDRLLHRIPLVNKVYKTSKEIVQALFSTKGHAFKQVVLIPFPYNGCYCVGLVSSDSPRTCTDASGQKMVSVFIPTTPNPTSGFLAMTPPDAIIYLDMKSEDAIKYIVSCAVVQPGKSEG